MNIIPLRGQLALKYRKYLAFELEKCGMKVLIELIWLRTECSM